MFNAIAGSNGTQGFTIQLGGTFMVGASVGGTVETTVAISGTAMVVTNYQAGQAATFKPGSSQEISENPPRYAVDVIGNYSPSISVSLSAMLTAGVTGSISGLDTQPLPKSQTDTIFLEE